MNTFPVINVVKTGQKIRELRIKNGLTIRDLQDKLQLATDQGIYKWQRGITLPSLDNMVVLASVFCCKIDDIIVVDGDISEY